MKRMWIGAALLILVLAAGIWAAAFMENTHTPAANNLDRAAELALADSWDAADTLLTRTIRDWQQKRNITAIFMDHEPLETIDGLFDQLRIYANARDAETFSSACVYLARQLEALGECHSFTLFNLL